MNLSSKDPTSRSKAQSVSTESARKITIGISDLLAQFTRPDFKPDGSINCKAAAEKLIRLRLLFRPPADSLRPLSGTLSHDEVLVALDQLSGIVEKRSSSDPLKRLWRNLSDLVYGHRTDFRLTAPSHAHYENVDVQFLKGSLVAIMRKKQEAGLPLASAASWLARRIQKESKLKRLGRAANVDAKDILSWRRQCQTKKSACRAAYREWLTALDGVTLTNGDCDAFVSAIAAEMCGPPPQTT